MLPPSDLVLDLASASGCSAYDCEYVALARHLDVKLITTDKQILQSFPETAIIPPVPSNALDSWKMKLVELFQEVITCQPQPSGYPKKKETC